MKGRIEGWLVMLGVDLLLFGVFEKPCDFEGNSLGTSSWTSSPETCSLLVWKLEEEERRRERTQRPNPLEEVEAQFRRFHALGSRRPVLSLLKQLRP